MELAVQKREKFGKSVKTLRAKGLIPAELYGKGVENLHLSVLTKDFQKVFKQAGESAMINVVVGSEKRPVMISSVALDPMTDEVLSADFYQIRLDEKIKIKVPFSFVGESPAVKGKTGILVKSMQEVEVEALPSDLPHSLEVRIDKLADIGNSICIKDLELPKDIRVLAGVEAIVATIIPPITEEQEQKLAATVDVADIKVETEEEKAERKTEKATAASGPTRPGAQSVSEKK